MGITRSCQNLEDTIVDGQERDIKGSTTKVVNNNLRLGLGLLVKSIGDGGSSGLVNNAENLKACDSASILGRLTLSVVKVYINVRGSFA
jgi:hypothetical protein